MKRLLLFFSFLLISTSALASIELKDEGTLQGYVWSIDCVGSNVACTESAALGTITISGSSGDITDVYNCSSGDCNNIAMASGDVLDAGAGQLELPNGTIANIIASPNVGDVYIATDGISSADCSTGGGSNLVYCIYNGTNWIPTSPGGGVKVRSFLVFDDSQNVATGDGAGDIFWRVPDEFDNFNLVDVEAQVQTAGTTGTTDIQIHNVTDGTDMLTTKITIDSGETDSSTAASPPIIDGTKDILSTADQIRFDVDAVSSVAPKGLLVELQLSPNLGGIDSPLDVPGLLAWWDAAQGCEEAAADACEADDTVLNWLDQSGNSHDLSQSTASKRPQYKTNIINSLPVMRFDGTDDWFTAASSILDQSKTYTAFFVAVQDSVADDVILATVNNTNGEMLRFKNNGGTQQMRAYASTAYDVNTGIGAGTFGVYTIEIEATTGGNNPYYITMNGGTRNQSASNGRSASHEYNLRVGVLGAGTSTFLDGDIAELILYEGAALLSDADRTSVENYLCDKYNITCS